MQLSFLRGSTTYLVRIDAMPEGHHDVYAPDVFGIETQIGTISPEERIGTLPQTWRALTAFDEPWKGERSVDSAAERIFDDFLNANYAKVTMGGQTFRVEMARDAKHVVQLCQARGQPLQEGAEILMIPHISPLRPHPLAPPA